MRIALLLCACAAALPAQSVLEGRVVDALTGLPLDGAYIEAHQSPGKPLPVSDAAGRFRIADCVNCPFLEVQRAGYVPRTQSLPFDALGKIAPVSNLQILLTPQAAIAGRVEDQDGVPVLRAVVEAFTYVYSESGPQLQRANHNAATDENGAYRLSGLAPGRYYLRVKPGKLAEWDQRYTPRYYPSALELKRAEAIEVKAGEQRTVAGIRLTKIEGVTISGQVNFPAGERGILRLESTDALSYSAKPILGRDGSFRFTHVPPGAYVLDTLQSNTQPRTGAPFARTELEVGAADMTGINLEAKPLEPIDVPGTIAFRDNARPASVRIELSTNNPYYAHVEAAPAADGSFVAKGLLPGHYTILVRTTGPSNTGWNGEAIAAMLGDRDVLRTGFDVGLTSPGALNLTLGSYAAKLSGALIDGAGERLWGAVLMLLPVQPGHGASGITGLDGVFHSNLVNAGDYRVYVESDADRGLLLRDPDYLKAHAGDYPVLHVLPGANPPVTLKMPPR